MSDEMSGMSLRDWFAAQFEWGDLEFGSLEKAAEFLGEERPDVNDFEAMLAFRMRVEAKVKYMFADAMLEYSKQGDHE